MSFGIVMMQCQSISENYRYQQDPRALVCGLSVAEEEERDVETLITMFILLLPLLSS